MADGDDNTLQFLMECVERGRNRGNQKPPSIALVPSTLRDLSPTSFNPRVVSIGPLAKMMVIDGCFILEFCLKHFKLYNNEHLPNKMQNLGIALDLILIENQIPFFVLQDMFDCTIKNSLPLSLTKILHKILVLIKPFSNRMPEDYLNTDLITSSTHDHILGYLHICYQLVTAMPSNKTKTPTRTFVQELARSDETFKRMTMKLKSSLTACFSWCLGKSTFQVPTLLIDDKTERVLRNLIAYEQSFPKVDRYFTTYACELSSLIHNPEDVETLVELKVLVNHLSSNREAAKLLNAICKDVLVKFNSAPELMQLKNYFNSYWLTNFRRLRHTYFSSPWKSIALVAGIILFSLTVVQTIFTIKAV